MQNPGWIVVLMLSLAGCQCCQLTEKYQDRVDCIADHEGHLDNWYCAGLDLTRIGYPDWCQYRINQLLCGRQCVCCRTAPPFIEEQLHYRDLNRAAPGNPYVPPQTDSTPSPTPANGGLVPPPPAPGVQPFVPQAPEVPGQIEKIPDPPQINPNETIPLVPLPPPGQSSYEPAGDPLFQPIQLSSFEWTVPEKSSKPRPMPQ
ncbi:hypothetical protein [Planctomicrobium sp. SH664]|uniref:hypothetical protein n=1 Tax=Planctomicrobium sp. SH664 TaxID=3448125 RepID=UPI003F5C46BA